MGFLNKIEGYLFKRFRNNFISLEQDQYKNTVLQSLLAAESNRKKENIQFLGDVEFSGFSQWGEYSGPSQ